MTLHVYENLEQGSAEWLEARAGLLTASVIGQLITTKTVLPAQNETARSLTAQLIAERITGHVEPMFTSDDMLRGTLDEPYARNTYAEHYTPVQEVGFMVREIDGYKIGYSPDGLVLDIGTIEIKSRRQKKHLATILADQVPTENMAQIQCGLLVSGRAWCDYISWCGGMPMWTKRVHPDQRWFDAITAAVELFEENAARMTAHYHTAVEGMPATERIDHFGDMEIQL